MPKTVKSKRIMKVLVCGSRDWDNYAIIKFRLSNLNANYKLVHGNARGADRISAHIWEESFNSQAFAVTADWDKYGKRAGILRNQKMLDDHPEIDLVIAFTNNLGKSKGTQDMVKRAIKAGLQVEVIREDTYYHVKR